MVDQLRYGEVLAEEPGYVDLDAKQTLTFRQTSSRTRSRTGWSTTVFARATGSIALPNDYRLRWIVACGVHKAGAVMVPANTRLSSNEMTAILSHAEISVMFTCDGLLDHARAVREQVPSLRAVVSADGPSDGILGWDDELAGVDASEIQVAVDADDMADIIHVGHEWLAEGRARPAPQRRDDPEQRCTGRSAGGCTAPLFTFGHELHLQPMKMGLTTAEVRRQPGSTWSSTTRRWRSSSCPPWPS
jgi:hypothetical protein